MVESSTDNNLTKPENANDHCPGVESEDAGKGDACAGCPNQNVCASGEARKEDPGKIFSIILTIVSSC